MSLAWRVLSVASLGLLIVFAGCGNYASKDANAGPVSRGSGAPMFTLPDLSGAPVSLEALLKENKAVLVNFWATWCPPCREEIPGLISLQKKYSPRGFTVLGVDVGESATKVRAFAAKMGISYPIALDGDNVVAERYGVFGIPTSLLIASDGKVLGEYHSYNEALVRDVEKALK